jgi:hypothetical protein
LRLERDDLRDVERRAELRKPDVSDGKLAAGADSDTATSAGAAASQDAGAGGQARRRQLLPTAAGLRQLDAERWSGGDHTSGTGRRSVP